MNDVFEHPEEKIITGRIVPPFVPNDEGNYARKKPRLRTMAPNVFVPAVDLENFGYFLPEKPRSPLELR